jgi:hypothetical protein
VLCRLSLFKASRLTLVQKDIGRPRTHIHVNMGSFAFPGHLLYPAHLPIPGIINIDESSEEDDDFSFEEDFEDERDILRPSTHALGLSKWYVIGWTCQDAFREFYQNW